MTGLITARIRTGRHNPQALYAQLGDEPSDDDPSIGWAKTPEIARQAVEAVNNGRPADWPQWPEWAAWGYLVYRTPADIAIGQSSRWIIALDSPELAGRIVAAVNVQVSDG